MTDNDMIAKAIQKMENKESLSVDTPELFISNKLSILKPVLYLFSDSKFFGTKK